jgi:hypothetical protein
MAEIPLTKTPASAETMGEKFLESVRTLSRQGLSLLIAHWAGETGWGDSMYGNNVGNEKSSGKSGNWHFLSCDENIPLATAQKLQAADPERVHIRTAITEGMSPKAYVNVWFDAPHPYTRFTDYADLDTGVAKYLSLIQRKYPEAWAVVTSGGTPEAFGTALKKRGYFTASLKIYLDLLKGTLAMVKDRAPKALAMTERIATESAPLS